MITENLSVLKIYKLTQEQYDKRCEDGNIEPNALYLTPDKAYADVEDFQSDLESIATSIQKIIDGSIVVKNAEISNSAIKDGNNNIITNTYETKTDSANKLTESKQYTDTKIDNHSNNKNNPHSVTKEQVGLGNVDNTSDMNKPVSNAQREAIDSKANVQFVIWEDDD